VTSDSQPADADVTSPFAVLTAVGRLATASEQASLVRLGLSSGLLARCAERARPSDLAAAVGAPEAAVNAVCTALVALGALRREGAGVRLSADWMPLARDGLDVRLERMLDGAAVRQRLIEETLSGPATYWELDSARRRALAESVTLPSTTAFGRAAARGFIAEIPGLDEELRSGARWLELGCGVAGVLLGTAHQYPGLRAVGVDIAPDLLEVARARAQELGVGDRVQFRECDASTFADAEPFDLVLWNQFFFPAGTRKAALENAFARLRPGGLLLCPVLPGEDESPEAGSPGAQQASLNSIIISRWGIPVLSGDDLAQEITAAGFSGTRAHRGNIVISVTARRA
jgi:SAM-dependent methyltransferase